MSQKLKTIIRHYVHWKNQNPDTWIQHCANQKNLRNAIRFASLSENAAGKRHPHQRRLKKNDMQNFETTLLYNIKTIKSSQDFVSLHEIVEKSAVKGIGKLMIYDTAVRIGSFLGLSPNRIYLHAGTKTGVTKLIGKTKDETISKNQLPEPFKSSNLNCYQLEDILCIYKDSF